MKVLDKIGDKETKIKSSVHYLYYDTNSPIMCDNCHKPLGLCNMLRQSIKVKKGKKYIVVCKRCKTINTRIKGDAGLKLDERYR